MFKIIFISFFIIILVGCANTNPLNISKEQWNLMTQEEKFEAYKKQSELNMLEQKRRITESKEKEALYLKRLAELDNLRSNAVYGDRIQCVLSSVEIFRRGEWISASPISLDLVRNNKDYIEIRTNNNIDKLSFNFQGTSIEICSLNKSNCAYAHATQRQLIQGYNTKLEELNFLKAELYCDVFDLNSKRK